MTDRMTLPDDLPVPTDDGACAHLPGMRLPSVTLAATNGEMIDPAALAGRTVLYCYPRTGAPGEDIPEAWNMIPGARGCTPQSCGFRDHHAELAQLGARVFGVSTQDTAYQEEVVERLHLPFPLLSDASLALTGALSLPTFAYQRRTLIRRLTMVVRDGVIEHVFYPVFPPDANAAEVAAWLRSHPG
jgi:peroxiredoxin